MSRKHEYDIDDELEEWEPFLHHRNRAHRKSEGTRRHINQDEFEPPSVKRKRKPKRTTEVFG